MNTFHRIKQLVFVAALLAASTSGAAARPAMLLPPGPAWDSIPSQSTRYRLEFVDRMAERILLRPVLGGALLDLEFSAVQGRVESPSGQQYDLFDLHPGQVFDVYFDTDGAVLWMIEYRAPPPWPRPTLPGPVG